MLATVRTLVTSNSPEMRRDVITGMSDHKKNKSGGPMQWKVQSPQPERGRKILTHRGRREKSEKTTPAGRFSDIEKKQNFGEKEKRE